MDSDMREEIQIIVVIDFVKYWRLLDLKRLGKGGVGSSCNNSNFPLNAHLNGKFESSLVVC